MIEVGLRCARVAPTATWRHNKLPPDMNCEHTNTHVHLFFALFHWIFIREHVMYGRVLHNARHGKCFRFTSSAYLSTLDERITGEFG